MGEAGLWSENRLLRVRRYLRGRAGSLTNSGLVEMTVQGKCR